MLPGSAQSVTGQASGGLAARSLVEMEKLKSSRLKLQVVETFAKGVDKAGESGRGDGLCQEKWYKVRKVCESIAESAWFTSSVLFLIILNSIFLALYDPLDASANEWIEHSEWVFQSLFTVEAIIKIVHLGVKVRSHPQRI